MASQSKSEKVKIWIKEYLSEFGEYSGTLEELANLANASPYLIKKALSDLEEEGFLKAESKRGKGLLIVLVSKEEAKEEAEEEKKDTQEVPAVEETKPQPDEKEEKKKKKVSLQDQVLNSLLGKDIIVFLISGTRLEGKLLDFDNFTLSMTAPKGKSLVYKHAIATIIFE
ncbi:RNA chaperone Hfq [Phorcysia thermohydrogeniphila]|uniref:RNA chaperone Hfq n=1 Tax=Phorcysia thermohydrogeniphila TaxID=936138 RepID=A0A4R1GCT1_9BACT|nr:RNA chaperone Hfq [Phorcysia thermohydrogeniphila]TCK04571.1 RNA chaperone Hfq [Phorcysia thermohydrogeniphila]